MADNSFRDIMQIMILILLALNLALTTTLWLDRSDGATAQPVAAEALPDYADSAELSRIADRISEMYNAKDYAGMYEIFDTEARWQFELEDVEREFSKLESFLGQIEDFTFSHFEQGGSPQRKIFEIHYTLKLGGGEFATGKLIITAVDRGDHLGIFAIKLNGGS